MMPVFIDRCFPNGLTFLPIRVLAPKPWEIAMEVYGFKDVVTILLFPSVLRRIAMSKVLAQSPSGVATS
jgi:hypothetical protein